MFRNIKILFGAAAVLLGSYLPAQAQVGGPYNGGGNWWWGAPYNYSQREHLPYYSLHPPVYYSLPVARSYGYSPWAYPPGTMTPEVEIEPMTLNNPYVPKKEIIPAPKPKARKASDRVASKPLVLINPFVKPSGSGTLSLTGTIR